MIFIKWLNQKMQPRFIESNWLLLKIITKYIFTKLFKFQIKPKSHEQIQHLMRFEPNYCDIYDEGSTVYIYRRLRRTNNKFVSHKINSVRKMSSLSESYFYNYILMKLYKTPSNILEITSKLHLQLQILVYLFLYTDNWLKIYVFKNNQKLFE